MAGGERGEGMFERVRESFARQGIMGLLGVHMTEVGEGRCVVEVPYTDGLAQQQRYFHGTVAGAISDNAGCYAALSLAPEGREVLTASTRSTSSPPRGGRSRWLGGR
jgi:acyl-coenzyme A thioesterase PaaI-like protein